MRHTVPVAALVVLAACGPKTVAPTASTERASAGILSETASADGLTEQKIDLNGDGRADVYNFYKERAGAPRLLVRKEVDLNWDGKLDVRTWFDAAGKIEKEEMDGDFDGRVDWVDHYQGGRRVLSEVDSDYDGGFDLFKVYEAGKVRSKQRDTNADGNVDFWEYLDDSGNVVKTGRDVDGDGIMDVRED
jgi:hypothetical protein